MNMLLIKSNPKTPKHIKHETTRNPQNLKILSSKKPHASHMLNRINPRIAAAFPREPLTSAEKWIDYRRRRPRRRPYNEIHGIHARCKQTSRASSRLECQFFLPHLLLAHTHTCSLHGGGGKLWCFSLDYMRRCSFFR